MERQEHWEAVYRTKRTEDVSWFAPHLTTSLELIRATGITLDQPILDVGGGASTLVDDLLEAGFRDVTVLDLSESALAAARARLGPAASRVGWTTGDITTHPLPARHFRVWHDRAVFHFLPDAADRDKYIAQVRRALVPGGHIVLGTFALDGPEKCSGLTVARYDATALQHVFGPEFELIRAKDDMHKTPWGTEQHFTYCL